VAFFWAVRSGQYEDDYSPSVRMLFDNTPPQKNTTSNNQSTSNTKQNNEAYAGEI
jgi:nitrogen fixation-related uncharacterized protein